jgi:hypothetical protein
MSLDSLLVVTGNLGAGTLGASEFCPSIAIRNFNIIHSL